MKFTQSFILIISSFISYPIKLSCYNVFKFFSLFFISRFYFLIVFLNIFFIDINILKMEKDNEKKERKITVNTTTQPVVAIFLFL